MTSIEMIEKVLKAMMTETTLSVNHSFMSMTMTRINSLPLKKYPTSVGEIQLELESQAVGKPSHENVQPNLDLSVHKIISNIYRYTCLCAFLFFWQNEILDNIVVLNFFNYCNLRFEEKIELGADFLPLTDK